ncbi:hypothetical protein [Aurantimonas sp. VKM B-3413]|uniref:hypothetical protein n=1 Tax=Aurantimonas sp. VKM B-3413 TaxID=2779401 RepID=UPI001E336079|nr:hypothetical protein [Aurantimonas sp. VKM B-3413]
MLLFLSCLIFVVGFLLIARSIVLSGETIMGSVRDIGRELAAPVLGLTIMAIAVIGGLSGLFAGWSTGSALQATGSIESAEPCLDLRGEGRGPMPCRPVIAAAATATPAARDRAVPRVPVPVPREALARTHSPEMKRDSGARAAW